jgi:hypothetical protein
MVGNKGDDVHLKDPRASFEAVGIGFEGRRLRFGVMLEEWKID